MNKELAEVLFPNIKITVDEIEAKYPLRDLKEGAYVTRFGPSPTGFMHVGSQLAEIEMLRTEDALIACPLFCCPFS